MGALSDLRLFGSAFGLIFLAELPDKTALAAVTLAARGRPGAVFCGAAAALAIQSLVAVCFGGLLNRLPALWVKAAAGLLFLGFAAAFWLKREERPEPSEARDHGRQGFLRAAWAAFAVVFIAEWGDLTQLATAALSAEHGRPLTIFLASTLALWAAAGLAVLVGDRLAAWIKPAALQRAAAGVFAAAGLALLMGAAPVSRLKTTQEVQAFLDHVGDAPKDAKRSVSPGRVVEISQDLLNDYASEEAARRGKGEIRDVRIELGAGKELELTVRARADWKQILRAKGDSFASKMIAKAGGVESTITARLQTGSAKRMAYVRVLSVKINGLSLPRSIIDDLLDFVGRKQRPPLDLNRLFPLPYGIQKVEVLPGRILLHL